MGGPISLTLEKSFTIDQIYNQVKDHDLVLTVDAPLADALNARLTEPRLGHFATTPRRLALSNITGENVIEDKRELFFKIIDKTDLSWKHATYLLQNIISCWRETGDIDNILQYDRFKSSETERMIDILKEDINPYNALDGYEIPDNTKTAVIAPHQFTALDKKILPKTYTTIEVFTDKKTELPEFKIFNSTTEIIRSILENIDDPNDTAVVMTQDSPYQQLIESTFRKNDIPYMVSMDLTEDEDLRTYLKLLRYGLSKRGLKLKDVKPILYHLEKTTSIEKDNLYLENLDEDYLEELKSLLNNIGSLTFKESVETYEDLLNKEQPELKEHLDFLNLIEQPITEESLNSFEYYLDSFDITMESAGRGVLIASPKTSAFIDRPTVFYLGMDSSWSPEPPAKPWADKKTFDKKKKKDFNILIQNGENQYFLVKNKSMNQHITPSYYFNELTEEEEVEKFTDFEHTLYGADTSTEIKPFEKEDIYSKPKQEKTLSQSSLNVLAYCPKDYFFSKLVDTPDMHYFKRGNLLHDFAEFYIHHPDYVEAKDDNIFLELMMEEISPYIDEMERDIWETQFNIGIKNLKAYLDPTRDYEPLPGYDKIFYNNLFSDHFDKPIEEPITEAYFKNYDVGASGIVDLIKSETQIVDHKSGKKKSIGKIMRLSDIHNIDGKPNFQAKLYIAHHRSIVPNRPIRFTFYHMLDNLRDVVSGNGNIADNMVTINYYPKTFNDTVQDQAIYNWLIDGVSESNNRRRVLETIGYDDYRDFFEDEQIPEGDKDEVLDTPLLQRFITYCEDIFGKDPKYITKGCKSTFKKLVKFRNENYFKDDIDEFEDFLHHHIEKLNEYKSTEFPVGEVDPDELDNKDMVII